MDLCIIITRMINRLLQTKLQNRIAHFPAVVLLGPRQVGKTTLALTIAKHYNSVYLDLQDPREIRKLSDPNRYLEAHVDKLVILDEVHRAPEIFQILRGSIDRGRQKGIKTGRFLLLGSASITLLKQTSESLAGRIATVELPPVSLLEIAPNMTDELWLKGGFPESLLAGTADQSLIWRDNFIRTYLERDIPEFGPRIPVETLYRFWTMLAHSQASLVNAAQLARTLSISGKTVARYLDFMVDLLLLRRIRPFHANVKKRLVKTPKIYVRDSGVVHALLDISNRDTLFRHPIFGASWEGFVIDNLLAVAPERTIPSFYRTIAGAEIDLILEFPGLSEKWAIEIKGGSSPKPTRGFYNALTDIEPDMAFVVYAGEERYPLADGVDAIGLSQLAQLILDKSKENFSS